MPKRTPTTKNIALLHQLFKNGQVTLAAEFQRNAVWPNPAKAYLIDTIMNDRPIPLLFFQRTTSAQTGLQTYTVIDGQQRLRAIFEFLEDRFRLTQSAKRSKYYKKRFSELTGAQQDQIWNYDFIIEELFGYSDGDITDMFVRINKYVVQLSPQELRHAKGSGKFHDFVEKLGRLDFWKTHKVFSPKNIKRMRAVEFSAELTILLIEGPQDKKASVDLYYGQYSKQFPGAAAIEARLKNYLAWIAKAVPSLPATRYRKPVDLYTLIAAVDRISDHGAHLSRLVPQRCGANLLEFEAKTKLKTPTEDAARYVAAASRQTDNLTPRTTRIEILERVLRA
jgi:Protein of unknown function DUF262